MIIGWGLMPDQIIEVNPHFEEQMTDQLNKLPLLKLEYKFLDAGKSNGNIYNRFF